MTTSDASPSVPAAGWHLVDPAFPKIATDYQYYQPQVFGLASGGFVAFLSQGYRGDTAVYRSDDGTTWHQESGLPQRGATVAAVAEDGARIVAVGFTDDAALKGTPMAWTTTDMQTWHSTVLPAPKDTGAFKVVAGPKGFLAWGVVATSSAERSWISADGVVWKALAASPAGSVTLDLTATDNEYVETREGGGMLSVWRSNDGSSWTKTWSTSAGSDKESYTMGRALRAPGGGYISFGVDWPLADPAALSHDWLVWTSSDLSQWTMTRAQSMSKWIGYIDVSGDGYLAAGSQEQDATPQPGACPSHSGCQYGALEVWTSSTGLSWHQVDGIAGITGLQVLTVASDGSHAIVVCRDRTDHVQLVVEAGSK
jgi:hypothetical protein